MNLLVMAGAGVATAVGSVSYRLRLRWLDRTLDAYFDRVDALRPDEVSAMATECVAEFGSRLGMELDLDDLEGSAGKLDKAFATRRTIALLRTPDQLFRAAELAGAFAGELVRRHGRGEWMMGGGRSPGVRVRRPDGDREIFPFVDTLNHFKTGRTGDLRSLILFVAGRDGVQLRSGHWAENREPME